MRNYEAEKLKKIIKAKEEAMALQVEETDTLRKELTKLKSSLLYSEEEVKQKMDQLFDDAREGCYTSRGFLYSSFSDWCDDEYMWFKTNKIKQGGFLL